MTFEIDDLLNRLGAARGRPTAIRMRHLEHQIRQAHARLRRDADGLDRIVRGVGEWADYVAWVQGDAEAELVAAVPSLLLRFAWRESGFSPPWASADPRHTAFDILSRMPDHDVPADLTEAASGWAWDVLQPGTPLLQRRAIALGMLMLGPDGGVRRRKALWDSGLVEQRAADEACASLLPGPRDIGLGEYAAVDWDLVRKIEPSLRSHRLPAAFASHAPLSYDEVAVAICDEQWRDVLGSGKTRPDEDTDDEDVEVQEGSV